MNCGICIVGAYIYEAFNAVHMCCYATEIVDGKPVRVQRSPRPCSKSQKKGVTMCSPPPGTSIALCVFLGSAYMARADCIPHKAFVLLWISNVLHHTHLRNGVANVVVQEGEFQSPPDRSLAPLFEDHRHQGGNDDRFHSNANLCVVHINFYGGKPIRRTKSANRGSECRLSKGGVTLISVSPPSRFR